jgi:hypothetical protein
MSEDQRKILDMLAQGKITVDEAEKLLSALSPSETGTQQSRGQTSPPGGIPFRYLRVTVEPGPNSETKEKVNVRVPLKMIRAGLKWAALMPKEARVKVNAAFQEKGIDLDFNKITAKDIEELVGTLGDLTVEIEGKEQVRVFCE